MYVLSRVSKLTVLLSVFYFSTSSAVEIIDQSVNQTAGSTHSLESKSTPQSSNVSGFSNAKRWHIKRQVMSMPGVMLDMANMTDSGYQWTNDVVWIGTGLPDDDHWYTAGFLFQKPGYKSVWLQYAFTLRAPEGTIHRFRRWYGAGAFR